MTGRVDIVWRILRKFQKSTILRCFQLKFTKNDVFRSGFFPKICQSISNIPVILYLMKICVARTFLVELHQSVVLEVLLVVGSKFLFHMCFKCHKMGMKFNILSILLHPSQFVYNYIINNLYS